MKTARIVEQVYRRLLRETIDLGDVEFSPSRVDGAPKHEKDTKDELQLAKDVKRWLDASAATPDFSRKLRELMRDPKYAGFFHPPEPGSIVFRGKTDSLRNIARLIGAAEHDLKTSGTAKGDFSVPIRKGVASWTYSRGIANEFANRPTSHTMPDHVAVVMFAAVDDNPGGFIDMHDMVRRVFQWKPYEREAEVLALAPGQTSVFRVDWSPMRDPYQTDGE